jgi:hypothetical protein
MSGTVTITGTASVNGKFNSSAQGGGPGPFTPLLKNDFSAGTLGAIFSTWEAGAVYANDQPSAAGKSLKVTVSPNTQANLDIAACAGSSVFGGRSSFPVNIPIGKSVWVSWKRYIPANFTWGYCYGAGDTAAATACGESADGNAWLKDLVFSQTSGGRIYVQPAVARRSISQSAGNRIIAEQGALVSDQGAVSYPLGQWFTHQVQVYVHNTSAGYIREWINSTMVNELTGANVATASNLIEFGMGNYWNGVPYTNGSAGLSQWLRELIIATDVSGYGAPTGRDSSNRVFIDPSTTVASLP